jgi:hypothetical protein
MRRTLIPALTLGLLLVACADAPSARSGAEPAAAVWDAAERTLAAGSARVHLAVDVATEGEQRSVEGTAELVFDPAGPQDLRAHVAIEVPGIVPGAPSETVELIVDRGPVLYLKAGALASIFPARTPWISIDPAAMGEGWPGVTGVADATDPAAALEALDALDGAIDVEEVGDETIDGGLATHYRATLDADALLEGVPADARADLREALRELRSSGTDVSAFPVDVWVAGGFLKRVTFAAAGKDAGSVSATITFSDVGAPFTIEPPPPDQVTDLSDLGSMWGGDAFEAGDA